MFLIFIFQLGFTSVLDLFRTKFFFQDFVSLTGQIGFSVALVHHRIKSELIKTNVSLLKKLSDHKMESSAKKTFMAFEPTW